MNRYLAALTAVAGSAVVGLAALPLPAAAQTAPPNPFTYTCAELLAAEEPQQRAWVNLMVYWSVGYMYGRLEDIERLNLDGPGFDQAVSDILTVLNRVCPNVPEMPMAEFMGNLATDIESQTAE